MKTLHLVSILDRSGSMGGTEVEVIGAYNAFIDEQKELANKLGYTAKATLVLFDDRYDMIYKKVPISLVPKLDDTVYKTRGWTALNDALGKTIAEFEGKKKVQFFIETDGIENCSKEFTGAKVKQLIEQHKHWDFNFVGADLSSAETASIGNALGINKTTAFAKTHEGYATRNATFAASTLEYVNSN